MALNGTINGSTNNNKISSKIVWSATQSIAGNYSDVTATLYYSRTNTGYTTSGNWSGSININGTSKSGSGRISITYNSNTVAISNTVRVHHNGNGSKSITISASGGIPGTSFTSTNISGTVTLNTIPRQATLTSAPNFTDKQNPVIKYSNSAGNSVTSLQACISLTGSNPDIAYRDISKTGNSYTFNLTTAERNLLRNATTTSNSRTVKFYIKTVIGGVTYYHSLTKTFSIADTALILSPTIKVTDSTSQTLTGNQNKIVRYVSSVQVATGAVAQSGATVKSNKITCGSKVLNAASGIMMAVESNVFTFSATDSRGNTTSVSINKADEGNYVNYIPISCNLNEAKTKLDSQGRLIIESSGHYFNGSFGAVTNTLTTHCRYKIDGGEWSTWIPMYNTLGNGSYTAIATITSLDYKAKYYVQLRAVDKVKTVFSQEFYVQSIPIFDWGKDDFFFNVPVTTHKGINMEQDAEHGIHFLDDGMQINLFNRNYDNSIIIGDARNATLIPFIDMNSDQGLYLNGGQVFGETILYNNPSGSAGTISLFESAANFTYLEIFYEDNNGRGSGYTKVYQPNGAVLQLGLQETGEVVYLRQTGYQISGNTITPDIATSTYVRFTVSTKTWESSKGTNYLKITRVVGLR